MSYQSFGFILFSAVVLLAYYLIGRKRQLWVLAAANLIFYAIAGVEYLPFILVTMVSSFFAARKIGAVYEQSEEVIATISDTAEKKELRKKAKSKAKRILLIAILIAAGLLAVCKYTGFIVSNLNLLFSALNIPTIKTFEMILPLGISFYTFMALSYVLDVYWKRYKAERNFLIYAVYLSYFPHVVQGPIDRFNEFKDQLTGGIAFSYQNLTFGAQLAVWGFFKKLVVADRLGMFVDTVIGNYEHYNGAFIIAAIAVYSIQIYADFSGCIDIVTGVSEMFGIKLRQNFNHPYFSKTMAEFWRRWHISLQEWFKDYIYYPVSTGALTKRVKKYFKSKGKKRAEELFASCFPILVVWIVTGIWHGAAWKFVAWGLFHAMLLIGSHVLEPVFLKLNKLFRVDTNNFGWHLWQMIRTFFLCCVGRVFFRAASLRTAFSLFAKSATASPAALFNLSVPIGLELKDIVVAVLAVLVLLFVDILQEKIKLRQTLARQNIIFRWIIIFAGLFSVIIFGIYGPEYNASSFIYEQF